MDNQSNDQTTSRDSLTLEEREELDALRAEKIRRNDESAARGGYTYDSAASRVIRPEGDGRRDAADPRSPGERFEADETEARQERSLDDEISTVGENYPLIAELLRSLSKWHR